MRETKRFAAAYTEKQNMPNSTQDIMLCGVRPVGPLSAAVWPLYGRCWGVALPLPLTLTLLPRSILV